MNKKTAEKRAAEIRAGYCVPWPLAPGAGLATAQQMVNESWHPREDLTYDWEDNPTGPDWEFSLSGYGDASEYFHRILWGTLREGADSPFGEWFRFVASRVCTGVNFGMIEAVPVVNFLMACNIAVDLAGGGEDFLIKAPAFLLDYVLRDLASHRDAIHQEVRDSPYCAAGTSDSRFIGLEQSTILFAIRYLCSPDLKAWIRDMIDSGGTAYKLLLVSGCLGLSKVLIEEKASWRGLKELPVASEWDGLSSLIEDHSGGIRSGSIVEVSNIRAFREALTSLLTEETVYEWAEEFAREFPGLLWPDHCLKHYLKLYFP